MCGEEGPACVSPALAPSHSGCLWDFYSSGTCLPWVGSRGLFWTLGEGEAQVKEVAQTCYDHFRLEALQCGSREHLIAHSPGLEQGQGHLPGCLPAVLAPGDVTQEWLPTLHSRLYHCLIDAGCRRAAWAENLQREASGDRKINSGSLTCSDRFVL